MIEVEDHEGWTLCHLVSLKQANKRACGIVLQRENGNLLPFALIGDEAGLRATLCLPETTDAAERLARLSLLKTSVGEQVSPRVLDRLQDPDTLPALLEVREISKNNYAFRPASAEALFNVIMAEETVYADTTEADRTSLAFNRVSRKAEKARKQRAYKVMN